MCRNFFPGISGGWGPDPPDPPPPLESATDMCVYTYIMCVSVVVSCPAGMSYDDVEDTCWRIMPKVASDWLDAVTTCETMYPGAHLPEPRSEAEQITFQNRIGLYSTDLPNTSPPPLQRKINPHNILSTVTSSKNGTRHNYNLFNDENDDNHSMMTMNILYYFINMSDYVEHVSSLLKANAIVCGNNKCYHMLSNQYMYFTSNYMLQRQITIAYKRKTPNQIDNYTQQGDLCMCL